MKNHTHQFLNSGHPNLDFWMTTWLNVYLDLASPAQAYIQLRQVRAFKRCTRPHVFASTCKTTLCHSSILVMQTCLHLHVHDSVYSVIGKVQSLSALREIVWPWTSILTPRNERKQRGPYFLQLCECAPLRIKFYTNVPAATWTRKFHANVFSCRSHVTYMDMTKFESPRYDWIEEIVAFIVRLEQ